MLYVNVYTVSFLNFILLLYTSTIVLLSLLISNKTIKMCGVDLRFYFDRPHKSRAFSI